MDIYIMEDDKTMAEILRDMIEDHEIGRVVGCTPDGAPDLKKICSRNPDIILIDFLMPGKDGTEVVRELKSMGISSKFIMISQVASKDMIGKAYEAGIDFFISKPVNLTEVRSVIGTVSKQIKNERTVSHLRTLFISEMEGTLNPFPESRAKTEPAAEGGSASSPHTEDAFIHHVEEILIRLGMAGERGSRDIVHVCRHLYAGGQSLRQESIREMCSELSDAPRSMEQRMRRAVQTGLINLAHLGIEDFMNDTFTRYSSTLFLFEEVRAEMDYSRGKRRYGGKVNLKRFIDSLMAQAELDTENAS